MKQSYTLKESFKFAINGFYYAARTQKNLRIQLIVAGVVILISLFLPMTYLDWAVLFFLIASVIVAELFNTAIEKAVDLFIKEYHPTAKTIKDVSAAAVLFIALISAIVGFIVYVPKILPLL